MNFSQAIQNQTTTTTNGMTARISTASANVDLFFKIGASRGKDIIPSFVAAFVENPVYAARIAQWARDVRGGAGERQLFRDILSYLEKNSPDLAMKLISKIPTIGRWDDMLIEYSNLNVANFAYTFYGYAINSGDGLAAKWAPRKGIIARQLRAAWGMTPKQYRKTLVALTNVVESKMCSKRWNDIEFDKIPSLAHARYKAAFLRNAKEAYEGYANKLQKGEAKINAGAVYPYDVLKGITHYGISATEQQIILSQWEALPNLIGDANVFPMVDVSGSMTCSVGGNNNLSCLQVAVSLGLYCADKNTGKFKDCFLTFSGNPEIINLKGNILQKCQQMVRANWGMNTNLNRAFEAMLRMAVGAKVPASEMPKILLIFSDMQFDQCTNLSAHQMIRAQYNAHGYEMPAVVFWNLNAHDNVPVRFDERGVALVSGFSPSIMKSILAADLERFTPENIMLDAIMNPRYDF